MKLKEKEEEEEEFKKRRQKETTKKEDLKEQKQLSFNQKMNADQTQTQDQWSSKKGSQRKEDQRRDGMKSQRLTQKEKQKEEPKSEAVTTRTMTEGIRVQFQAKQALVPEEKKEQKEQILKTTSTNTTPLPDLASIHPTSNLDTVHQSQEGRDKMYGVKGGGDKMSVTSTVATTVTSSKGEDEFTTFLDHQREAGKTRQVIESPSTGDIHQSNSSSIRDIWKKEDKEQQQEEGDEIETILPETEVVVSAEEEDNRRRIPTFESHLHHETSSYHHAYHLFFNRLTVYISAGISIVILLMTFFVISRHRKKERRRRHLRYKILNQLYGCLNHGYQGSMNKSLTSSTTQLYPTPFTDEEINLSDETDIMKILDEDSDQDDFAEQCEII